MGIPVEFNPDLALRPFGTENRLETECLPEKLEVGKWHHFLKRDHRNYWMNGEVPLRETKGNGELSRPLASVRIKEITLYATGQTSGVYEIIEVYDPNDPTIHFEGMEKIK